MFRKAFFGFLDSLLVLFDLFLIFGDFVFVFLLLARLCLYHRFEVGVLSLEVLYHFVVILRQHRNVKGIVHRLLEVVICVQ